MKGKIKKVQMNQKLVNRINERRTSLNYEILIEENQELK